MITIDEIEKDFELLGYPKAGIEIRPGMVVKDGKKFVSGILETLRGLNIDSLTTESEKKRKRKQYQMYYDNLLKYYQKVKWS